MGSEVEEHITKKYDIKKRLGKGVRKLFYRTTVVIFYKLCWYFECVLFCYTAFLSEPVTGLLPVSCGSVN